MPAIKNQLRRCNVCDKLWQTHEREAKLFRCPNCGSTRKEHELIKGEIFIHHLISTAEYTKLLLGQTWHDVWGKPKIDTIHSGKEK